MKIKIDGMVCESCEKIITKVVSSIKGVKSVKVDYVKSEAEIDFNSDKVKIEDIFSKLDSRGYSCSVIKDSVVDSVKNTDVVKKVEDSSYVEIKSKHLGIMFASVGFLVAAYFIFHFVEGINLPEITQGMSYGLLFVVGLLTGFHCISMCGGFVLSYTAKDANEGKKSHKSHFMYGFGKTVSYTVIGAMFGLLGSIIAFTPNIRAAAGILSGMFLLIFGLKMLNIFPVLRKFSLKTPRFVAKWVGTKQNSSPLVIGLLNGLMIACGPLQAIYIMAAGTGSLIEGAKLLFVFGLGTLPVMLGFGYFASFISSKATTKLLKASGAIVMVLGLIMINNGLVLSGSGYDVGTMFDKMKGFDSSTSGGVVLDEGYQIIEMNVTRYGWEPNEFVLQKDVPVKWQINGVELTGCNNAIQVPDYGLEFKLKEGMQTITFTPTEEGIVKWSCWMGMIPGTFIVKEDLSDTIMPTKVISAPIAGGCGGGTESGGCGGSCGGGCGGGCGA